MIRTLLFALTMCSAFTIAFAQPQASILEIQEDENGISFFEGDTWEAILAQAEKEDKIIFVDAYTTWCGPCKWMAKNIFPDASVGSFFNKNFVNVKIDMEKGYGKDVAKKYNVRQYPTYLFVAADGELVHRGLGSMPADKFITVGKSALDPEKQYYTLQKKYEEGNPSKQLHFNYALASAKMRTRDASPLIDRYLSREDVSMTDDKSTQLIYFGADYADSKAFNYFVKHQDKFAAKYDKAAVEAKVTNAITRKLYNGEQLPSVQAAYDVIDKYLGNTKKAEQLKAAYKMEHYSRMDDSKNYAKAAIDYFNKFDGDSNELNNVAWAFYENVEDKKLLKGGAKLACKSIELEKTSYNTDTLAALYYKIGKKRKARKWAKESIALAKANNLDPSETERLLDKINGK